MSRNALLRASVRNRSVRRVSLATVVEISRHRLIALGVYLEAIVIPLVVRPEERAADLRPLEDSTTALLGVAAVETSWSGESVAAALSDASNEPEPAAAIEVAVLYTADWRRNASGGLRCGARFLDDIDLAGKLADGESRLGRLYGAIEDGVADATDAALRERAAAVRTERDIAQVALDRAVAELRPDSRISEDKIAALSK